MIDSNQRPFFQFNLHKHHLTKASTLSSGSINFLDDQAARIRKDLETQEQKARTALLRMSVAGSKHLLPAPVKAFEGKEGFRRRTPSLRTGLAIIEALCPDQAHRLAQAAITDTASPLIQSDGATVSMGSSSSASPRQLSGQGPSRARCSPSLPSSRPSTPPTGTMKRRTSSQAQSISSFLDFDEHDYPSWLADCCEEEMDWEVDAEDDFEIVGHPDARVAYLGKCIACNSEKKQVTHCTLCGSGCCAGCAVFGTILSHMGLYGLQPTCRGCHMKATGNRTPRMWSARDAPCRGH